MIVVASWESDTLGRSTQEALGVAARLGAELGTGFAFAALGADSAAAAAAAGGYGAARVFVFDTAGAVEREAALVALADLVRELEARVVLLVSDERSSEIGPRLAQRLGGTAVTHALAVATADDSQIAWTRPVFGGKALATVRAVNEPVVALLRRGAFEAAEVTGGSVEVEVRPGPVVDDPVELLEVEVPETTGIPLDQAPVIVSGGHGLGGGEAFAELEELAGLLGGAVGASLAAVDEGWVPTDRQVGLTGKTVSPDVYFAIGISGASQHLAGIGGAKAVVAVNTDPEAPIFGRARLGIVMDCHQLLPALIDEFKRRVAQQ